MAKSIFLMSSEPGTGKSIVSLGVFGALQAHFKKVAYYKPVATLDPVTGQDPYVALIQKQFGLPEASVKIGNQNLIETYRQLAAHHDFVLVEGLDYTGDNASTDFMSNLEIAKSIGCQIMLVEKGQVLPSVLATIADENLTVLNLILNHVDVRQEKPIRNTLRSMLGKQIAAFSLIPNNPALARPSMKEVAHKLKAEVFQGQDQLHRSVCDYSIAAKMVGPFLKSVRHREHLLVITPGDREDLILGCILADQSAQFPQLAGMVLTTHEYPSPIIQDILKGLPSSFPILITEKSTFEAAAFLKNAQYHLFEASPQKIDLAIEHIRSHLNEKQLIEVLTEARSEYLTPPMFTYNLLEQARKRKMHIVLPEGEDIRILAAADELLKRDIVTLTLLGNPVQIEALAAENHLHIAGANLIDPHQSPQLNAYAERYFELRQHKNVSLPIARDRMQDPNYFGSMMVYLGECDGMVSGAMHTTGETIRPALEFIKTQPGCKLVSSVFLICLKDRVLVYGDCAVNPDPDAETLSDIAFFSAKTAERFGIEPRIALLSYSSGGSGTGASVDKVRDASLRLKTQHPELLVEGPIQYDAAVDPSVAEKKMPNSPVAGRATVLIFPDLNSGNNTYKAVQRETGAIAIGPILQGLNKPVNDLSRGCTVKDIVNTIIITAIQAQGS